MRSLQWVLIQYNCYLYEKMRTQTLGEARTLEDTGWGRQTSSVPNCEKMNVCYGGLSKLIHRTAYERTISHSEQHKRILDFLSGAGKLPISNLEKDFNRSSWQK